MMFLSFLFLIKIVLKGKSFCDGGEGEVRGRSFMIVYVIGMRFCFSG